MNNRVAGPALFLVSSSLLAFEIILLRVFSVVSYHHFAYMAVGVALLGFGAGGTALVLVRRVSLGREWNLLPWLLALTAPAMLVAPVLAGAATLDATQLFWDTAQWWRLAAVYGGLALPFLVGSAAIALALQGAGGRVGVLYAWNLAGSGSGALGVVPLLALVPPGRALAWVAVPATGAALVALLVHDPRLVQARSRRRRSIFAPALRLASALLVTATTTAAVVRGGYSFPIIQYKGLPQLEAYPGSRRVGEAWDPTGWVTALDAPTFRFAPGLSLAFRGVLPEQLALFVDGEVAGGVLKEGGGEPVGGSGASADPPPASAPAGNDLAFLDWLPGTAPYAAAGPKSVLVLGSGSGLEVWNALRHGAARVTAVELVGPLVRLSREVAAKGASPYGDSRVTLVIGDARSFSSRTRERFSLVVLPVAGVFNATAAGVHSGGEDFLNTTEGYRSFVRLLEPGGILAVTRWLRSPPRDNVRVILTAAAALRALGVGDVGPSLVFLRSWATGTLLVKPDGFSEEELRRLAGFCESRSFDLDWPVSSVVPPLPINRIPEPVYREAAAAAASGPESVRAFARVYPFRVDPATDDRPYFGRFLRLGSTPGLLAGQPGDWVPVAEWGYLGVVVTFVQSGLLAVLLLVVPMLAVRRKSRAAGLPAIRLLLYFGGIGFGFILVEMALIQRLSLLLGHPVYAAAATLGSLLLFAGLGSRWSDRRPDSGAPAACLAAVGLSFVLALLVPLAGVVNALPLHVRATAALTAVGAAGILMGAPFPLGLRHLARSPGGVAWGWAANGVASVMGASMAVLLAMEVGGSAVLLAGGAFYLLAAGAAARSRSNGPPFLRSRGSRTRLSVTHAEIRCRELQSRGLASRSFARLGRLLISPAPRDRRQTPDGPLTLSSRGR